MDNQKEPVLVVTTQDGKLVHAGEPSRFDETLIIQYAKDGYNIKTITIEEYRATNWKWHWEK